MPEKVSTYGLCTEVTSSFPDSMLLKNRNFARKEHRNFNRLRRAKVRYESRASLTAKTVASVNDHHGSRTEIQTETPLRASRPLKPQIPHTSPIARQIVECFQPVEMIDRQMRHLFRRREAEIDRYAAAAVRVEAQAAPAQHAAAGRTKTDFESGRGHADARVGAGLAENANSLAFVIIGP